MTRFTDVVLRYKSFSFPTIHFSKTLVALIYQMCFSTGFNIGPSVRNNNASQFYITTIYDPDKMTSEGKISQILPSTIGGSNSGEQNTISS